MNTSTRRKEILVVLIFGAVGWALCGAAMGIGMALTTLENALIIHALAAPVIFFLLSWIYFSRYNYTTPLSTAVIFLAVVIFLDLTVVSMLINRNFEMFTSPIGTWIPFLLLFVSTYLTGKYINRTGEKPALA